MIDNDEIFLNSKFSLSRKIWLNPKKNIQKLKETNLKFVENAIKNNKKIVSLINAYGSK